MTAWPDSQRGAVTLIGALFIIVTLVIMIEALHRMTGSDVLDTAVQNDAVEALFIAESGIEHASYLLANGINTCTGLAGVNGSVGRGDFSINAGTLSGSDCQIRVIGAVNLLGVQRVVDATLEVGGNLLASANANFDDPPGPCWWFFGCTPTGWSLPPFGWDDSGGPDSSRAAQVWKPFNGGSTATTAGSFGLTPFTVTAPTTLTLNFDYRVQTSGGSPQEGQLSFSISDGTTTYNATPSPLDSGDTGGYVPGSVLIDIGGSGPVTITNLSFVLYAKAGQPKRIWLDNLDLQSAGGGTGVTLRRWQEIVSN